MRQLVPALAMTLANSCVSLMTYADNLHYYREVKPSKATLIECDVAVYGGTPAGVTAAIQAARMGQKALLFSFNHHVGGVTQQE